MGVSSGKPQLRFRRWARLLPCSMPEDAAVLLNGLVMGFSLRPAGHLSRSVRDDCYDWRAFT